MVGALVRRKEESFHFPVSNPLFLAGALSYFYPFLNFSFNPLNKASRKSRFQSAWSLLSSLSMSSPFMSHSLLRSHVENFIFRDCSYFNLKFVCKFNENNACGLRGSEAVCVPQNLTFRFNLQASTFQPLHVGGTS